MTRTVEYGRGDAGIAAEAAWKVAVSGWRLENLAEPEILVLA